MKTKIMKILKKELLIESVIFWTGIGSAILFFRDNLLLTLLFIILCSIRIKIWHKKDDILFFVSGAIFGSLSEIILINFGAWQYANPSFLGIPIWLPLAWGLATMMIKRFAEIFVKIETK